MSLLSEFAADFADGIFDVNDGMAVPAVYTPPGGVGVAVSVIMSMGEDLDDAQWKTALQASAKAAVLESEVSDPVYQGVLTVDGEDWSIVKKLGKSGGVWNLALSRDLRPTFKR